MVPDYEPGKWPTLGPQVVEWIEEYLVYGPGELKGEPYVVEPEFKAQIYRMYEIFPQGHKSQGRRRFKRASLSLRKGTGKTEKAAILAITELHPSAPVRCEGFDADGEPVGVGVASPYIPLVAFSQDQTEDLAFGVARLILEESPIVDDFDIGLERIVILTANGRDGGRIVPLGGSPNARDGARTTFQHVDESHRLYLPRLKKAHNVMLQNAFKRVGADPWTLETTTAFEPGQGSVAEDTYHHAEKIKAGTVSDPRLFYFHRQANFERELDTKEQVQEALIEASGPAAEWSGDIDALTDHWFEPGTDLAYMRRVWLNQPIAGSGKAFKLQDWTDLENTEIGESDEGELVVLGFDGARRRDATCLMAMDVERAHMWPLGIWQRPEWADDDWEVPSQEVDEMVAMAMERWDVWRLYGDPPYWDDRMDAWAGEYGDKKVIKWWTNRQKPMAYAVRNFKLAMEGGVQLDENGERVSKEPIFTHNGDPLVTEHVTNAFRQDLKIRDEDDRPLWVIRKERPNSENKIDAAMAGILVFEAYGDCVAAGMPRSRRNKKLVTF
jgi:hypothetical protein